MAAKEAGERLGEGRTRHDCVASGFLGFELEITLDVRDKSHDRGALLELGFQLGDDRKGLDAVAVQIDDNQRRFFLRILCQLSGNLFVGFYKFHFDIQFTANFLDFCEKEEIVDEAIYLGRPLLSTLERLKLGARGVGTQSIAKTPHQTRPRAIALIPVAMVHRADKDRVPPLITIAITVVAVVASALSALALLATLILLTALVLIAVIPSPTPRFPIGRILWRLIECIVHLFTCLVYGSLRTFPKMETVLPGKTSKMQPWLDDAG